MSTILSVKKLKDSFVGEHYGEKKKYRVDADTPIIRDSVVRTVSTLSNEFEPSEANTNSKFVDESIAFWTMVTSREARSIAEKLPYSDLSRQLIPYEISSATIDNYSNINRTLMIGKGIEAISKKLLSFLDLKKGWDSYNAEPIKLDTIIRALKFFTKLLNTLVVDKKTDIAIPFICPLSDGGIQFEWETCYKELIIEISNDEENQYSYLKVEKSIWTEKETEERVYSIDELVEVVQEVYFNHM